MIRSVVRAAYHIAADLLPYQAIRCCLDRDYSNAMYQAGVAHDGAEERAEWEAEEEVAEPAFDYRTICSQCGQPYSASACGPTHAIIAAERGTGAINDGEPQQVTLSGREYERYLDGALNEPVDVPDPDEAADIEAAHDEGYDRGRQDAERIASGMSPNVFNPYRDLPAASAGGSEVECLDCETNGVNCLAHKSSAVGSAQGPADGPPGLTHSVESPGGHLNWVDWAVLAIQEVLAEHMPFETPGRDDFCMCELYIDDSQGWREHVAPLIAEHLQQAANPPAPQRCFRSFATPSN